MNKLCILFLIGMAFSQELPNTGILVNGEVLPGFYKAGIRYGMAKGDSLYIKWSHAAEADTFWVHKANSNLEYITNADMRIVWYNQPLRYERWLATHHLREYIFDTPLKFSNLENLAKNSRLQFLGKEFHEYFMR